MEGWQLSHANFWVFDRIQSCLVYERIVLFNWYLTGLRLLSSCRSSFNKSCWKLWRLVSIYNSSIFARQVLTSTFLYFCNLNMQNKCSYTYVINLICLNKQVLKMTILMDLQISVANPDLDPVFLGHPDPDLGKYRIRIL